MICNEFWARTGGLGTPQVPARPPAPPEIRGGRAAQLRKSLPYPQQRRLPWPNQETFPSELRQSAGKCTPVNNLHISPGVKCSAVSDCNAVHLHSLPALLYRESHSHDRQNTVFREATHATPIHSKQRRVAPRLACKCEVMLMMITQNLLLLSLAVPRIPLIYLPPIDNRRRGYFFRRGLP